MQKFHLTAARSVVSTFFKSDAGKALLISFVWQGTLTLLGYLFDSSLSRIFQANTRPDGIISPLSHTVNWDSNWYSTIIQDAYETNRASSVFYPLLPLLAGLLGVGTLGLIDTPQVSIIINSIALFFAILALIKISDTFIDKRYRWWIVAAFVTSPAAIFMHFFYTEALFCAIGFWSYLFALRREWWKMAILLAILTSVRLPSILIIGLCGLEYMRAARWNISRIFRPQLLWFLLAPIGFLLYGIFLHGVQGDFFAMFHGYGHTKDWSYQVFNVNVIDTIGRSMSALWTAFTTPAPFDEGLMVNNLLPLLAIAALVASAVYSMVYLRDTGGVPLAIFAIAAIIFFSLNSNLVSVHRYTLPILTTYIALVHFTTSGTQWRRYIFITYLYGSVLLQSYLLILFVNSYFAG